MFRMSKMVGLALIGFMLVVCTISSAQQGKDDEKPNKGKFDPSKFKGMRQIPGKIFSTFVISQLKLTDDQQKQLDSIQKDVDEKIEKLLTDDQKTKLKDLIARPAGGGGFRPKGKDDPKKDDPKKDDKKDEKKDN